ncbi:ribbon-helix-helix protein, CopG family [Klebsiella sp. RHBSTW-00484]|nr:ribbon-helix-helix protein, CopG family [Klebsiella sp. RHBSTW-00465]QLO39991.1 ribbon-helix-helix protein, CopG family [Klebsiella sp. RHBSTW-00484]QLT79508.1 ribbon-helix-helix protein, CopG family [Klebsiella sp. RHBSTW-00464]
MIAGMDMGGILLDLSDDVIKRLEDLKQQRNLPRAELLREAVEQYLERQAEAVISNALGLWQSREEDGVEYEKKLREEWYERVTRNTKDFARIPGVITPYQL